MTTLQEKILHGTPYYVWKNSDIVELRKSIGATQEEFARIVGVVAATVHRWEKGIVKPKPHTARKLGRLKEIITLFQVGLKLEGLKFFFITPNQRLQGDCPMDLLNFDSGTERVKGLIESAMTGAIG